MKTAGISMHHVKTQPGHLLVIPPGYVIACTALNGLPALGVRSYFMPTGLSALANLSSLKKAFKDAKPQLDIVDSLLDLLVIAQKQQ